MNLKIVRLERTNTREKIFLNTQNARHFFTLRLTKKRAVEKQT